MTLPYYDKATTDGLGTCTYMGTDDAGCDVYILGTGPARRIVRRAVESIFEICGVSRDSYMPVSYTHLIFQGVEEKLFPRTKGALA